MYKKAPMTDRVARIRERYRNTVPTIDVNRYRIVTEFYMANPQLQGNLKRAKALREIFEKMPTPVFEDDLIVGFPGTTYRCCALYPEYGGISTIDASLQRNEIQTRKSDTYKIEPEDMAYIHETASFWDKNNYGAIAREYFPAYGANFNGNGVVGYSPFFAYGAPTGHFAGNHYKAVDVGFKAVAEEAEAKMREMEENGIFGQDIYKYNFYRGIEIVCTGFIHYAERYGATLEKMAEECTDEARKAELLEMADTMNWIIKNPARNFHDAIQIVYLYQLAFILDGQLHGLSLGRVDQFTGKYYEKDLAEGKITPERAQELVDCFVLKLAENNKVTPGKDGFSAAPGYTSGQLCTIGGVHPDGTDATNAVTYMFLQANGRMQLHDPPIALRVHDDMPDDLWEAAIEASKLAGGVPSYEYDGVIIPSLLKKGLSIEDARNYHLCGCVEPAGFGDWADPGGDGTSVYLNIAVLLLLAINNGVNPLRMPGRPEPRQSALPTGYLYEMNSIEEVMDACEKQMEYLMKYQVACVNAWESQASYHLQLPIVSAMFPGCMEKGMDVQQGGAKYNSTGTSCVGVGNLADSVSMIDHLCFKTKKCTTRELYDALMANWEGYEELYQYVNGRAPHYGNADPECDKYMTWAAEMYAKSVIGKTGPRGQYTAGCYPVTLNVMYGYVTPATPDGRKLGDPLTDGISPRAGLDKGGPVTTINSLNTFDQTLYANGTLCNMKFHPTSLNRADGWKKLRDVMATFFTGGGMELQLNIVSADTLRDAQKNPDNYKDLVVRVAGFSAYFVEVFKENQDDLIRRTEMSV